MWCWAAGAGLVGPKIDCKIDKQANTDNVVRPLSEISLYFLNDSEQGRDQIGDLVWRRRDLRNTQYLISSPEILKGHPDHSLNYKLQ